MHNKNSIIATAILITAAGFILPVTAGLANLLLIFGVCMAAAGFFVCYAAKDISEVPGLAIMISAGAGLSAAVLIIFIKLAFFGWDSGKMADFAGGLVSGSNGFILPAAGIVITVTVVLSAVKAGYSSGQADMLFKNEIAPLRKSSIHQRQYAGLIDSKQVQKEEQNLLKQSRFFEGMSAAGMFILAAEMFNVLVLVVGLVMIALGIEQAGMRKGAGIAGILQIPILFYAAGCNHIIRKSFYSLSPEAEQNQGTYKNRIKVFSKDVTEGFRGSSAGGGNALTVTGNTNTAGTIEDARWEDGTENTDTNLSGFLHDPSRIQTGRDYDNISRKLAGRQEKIIVMTGANSTDLPVTIPVNAAMRLAKSGKKVLLNDMDDTRNAVARVFDSLDRQKGEIYESCVRNLWTGQQVTELSKLNNFDFVIIYSPSEPAVRKIVNNSEISADAEFMVYGSGNDYRICEMIKQAGGKLYPPSR